MQPHLLVVCKGDAELVALDPASLAVQWRAGLSDIGHEVVASPDGTLAYVPLYGSGGVGRPGRSGDGVDVIDLDHGGRLATIPLPAGSRPHFAAWGRDDVLHITAEGTRSVLSVHAAGWAAARPVPLRLRELGTGHPESHMLAVSPGGRLVYTADVSPGSVTEIHVDSGSRRCLHLADRINRITISSDGGAAFVADQDEPRLALVDLRSMTLRRWIALPHTAFGTAVVHAGRLVVAFRQAGLLGILDTATGHILGTVSVPS